MELSVKQVQEVILETQEDRTLRTMYIHKSPCKGDNVGAVFFAIAGTPPKGYAMFLAGEGKTNEGMLHVFDELGLKRKILQVTVTDLGDYKDNDVFDAKLAKPAIKVQ